MKYISSTILCLLCFCSVVFAEKIRNDCLNIHSVCISDSDCCDGLRCERASVLTSMKICRTQRAIGEKLGGVPVPSNFMSVDPGDFGPCYGKGAICAMVPSGCCSNLTCTGTLQGFQCQDSP